jgi:DNA-binding transcriptional regulator YiaG
VPEEHIASLSVETGQERTEATRAAIHELRRLSGLTWEHLARICGVTRRTLHFWASGKPLTAAHEERLQRLLATMRMIDRGSAQDNRSVLLQPSQDGVLPFDLLTDGEYDTVVALLSPGGRARTSLPRAPLSAEARTARQPPPPEDLVGALQDRVHREVGKARAVRAIRMAQ